MRFFLLRATSFRGTCCGSKWTCPIFLSWLLASREEPFLPGLFELSPRNSMEIFSLSFLFKQGVDFGRLWGDTVILFSDSLPTHTGPYDRWRSLFKGFTGGIFLLYETPLVVAGLPPPRFRPFSYPARQTGGGRCFFFKRLTKGSTLGPFHSHCSWEKPLRREVFFLSPQFLFPRSLPKN